MRVLVIGSGGREHALVYRIARSPLVQEVISSPGNPGMAMHGPCVELDLNTPQTLVRWVLDQAIDLVVVGPEQPLMNGLADTLREAGVAVFGPNRAAARLEGSKAFCRSVCRDLGIEMAEAIVADTVEGAHRAVEDMGSRDPAGVVVKADGLAAGKGVFVCHDRSQAHAAVEKIMNERVFGAAGDTVVVEQRLKGVELSHFALIDESASVGLVAVRDHKSLLENGRGPNTGGMGAVIPTAVDDDVRAWLDETTERLRQGLVRRGWLYRGVIYLGVMVTQDGPRLLEINVRFGDPECQALMMHLDSDLVPTLVGVARGELSQSLQKTPLSWRSGATVGVVLAQNGYPLKTSSIPLPDERDSAWASAGNDADENPDEVVFHAGTLREVHQGPLIAVGGRVACAFVHADTVKLAASRARTLASRIAWPEAHWRTDIE